MADIFDWSTTPASNTTVDGINVNTGMPVQNVDNALRAIMAAVRNSFSAPLETFLNGTSALPVSSGGTGSTTAADARTALGLGTVATESTLPVAKGGTGATTADGALDGIGAIGIVASSLASPGYIKFNLPGTSSTFMIAWGIETVGSDSTASVTYPAAFSSFSIPLVSAVSKVNVSANENTGYVSGSATTSGFQIFNAENNSFSIPWHAVGV